MPGRVPDFRPLTEGPGPTSSPGSLPAPRVACRCSPAGFDRQHGDSQPTMIDASAPGDDIDMGAFRDAIAASMMS
jgi:hypothetical protein